MLSSQGSSCRGMGVNLTLKINDEAATKWQGRNKGKKAVVNVYIMNGEPNRNRRETSNSGLEARFMPSLSKDQTYSAVPFFAIFLFRDDGSCTSCDTESTTGGETIGPRIRPMARITCAVSLGSSWIRTRRETRISTLYQTHGATT